MTIPLDQPLSASNRLSNEFWKPWLTDNDFLLYHYTDAAGLRGIIESRKLWLTSISYLNDSTEYQQAGVALRKALNLLLEEPKTERHSIFYKYLERVVTEALTLPRLALDKTTFVGCFSKKADSLSQWRGYGRGEGGFSIALRANDLWRVKQGAPNGPGYWLLPCEYDLDRVVGLFKEFIEYGLDECISLDSGVGDEIIAHKLGVDARWSSAAIKHPAFEEEGEWRLIRYAFEETSLKICHQKNSLFRPYIEFELANENDHMLNVIEEIWVGPQRYPELAAESLKDYLTQKLGRSVPVRLSKVPFRLL